MGRLIDADKFLEKVKKDREHEIYLHSWTADMVLGRLDSWYAPTVEAIPIPKGATNGDMIKAMFPNLKYEEHGNSVTVYFDKKIGTIVTHDWWNAPYKENKDDNNAT